MNLHRRPLFMLTASYVAGIVCAAILPFGLFAGIFLTGALLLVSLRYPLSRVQKGACALMIAVFALGLLRTVLMMRPPAGDVSRYADGMHSFVTGRVSSDPNISERSTTLVLDAGSVKSYTGEHPVEGNVQVTIYRSVWDPKNAHIPMYGEEINVHGRLSHPIPATNPGSSHYNEFLARKGIFCTLSAGSKEVVIRKPAQWSMSLLASNIKSRLSQMAGRLFPSVYAQLLIGILMGGYEGLPLAVQTGFMRSGTMHLLAASGYNCGVVVAIFGFLLCRLTVPRSWRHVLLILALWMFTLVSGSGPSMVRASVMVTVFLGAYLLNRASDMVNTVLLACLVILAFNPLSLYDVGFQLSFAAVGAIVLMIPLLENCSGRWFVAAKTDDVTRGGRAILWTARTITASVVLSLVAGLGTFPITAYYFNYVSTVGVVANALTALLVLALTVCGIGALCIGAVVPYLGHLVAAPAFLCIWLMLRIVSGLGNLSCSLISVPSPPIFVVCAYYAVMLGLLEYVYWKLSKKVQVAHSP